MLERAIERARSGHWQRTAVRRFFLRRTAEHCQRAHVAGCRAPRMCCWHEAVALQRRYPRSAPPSAGQAIDQCPRVPDTISRFHDFTVSRFHCFTFSRFHSFSFSQLHSFTVPLFNSGIVSWFHEFPYIRKVLICWRLHAFNAVSGLHCFKSKDSRAKVEQQQRKPQRNTIVQ